MNWRRIAAATIILMLRGGDRGVFATIFNLHNRAKVETKNKQNEQERPNLLETILMIQAELLGVLEKRISHRLIRIIEAILNNKWRNTQLAQLSDEAKLEEEKHRLMAEIFAGCDARTLRSLAKTLRKRKRKTSKAPSPALDKILVKDSQKNDQDQKGLPDEKIAEEYDKKTSEDCRKRLKQHREANKEIWITTLGKIATNPCGSSWRPHRIAPPKDKSRIPVENTWEAALREIRKSYGLEDPKGIYETQM